MAGTASPSASPLLLPGPRSASRAWLRRGKALSSEAIPPSSCRAAAGGSAAQCVGADDGGAGNTVTRRGVVGAVALGVVSSSALCLQAFAGGLPPEEKPKLCDDACVKELENVR